MKRVVYGLMLIMLFLSVFKLTSNIQPIKAEPTTIIVPDDYSTIQEAINVAETGDVIFVKAGMYFENIVVNKSVSLVGENRENTIIDGQRMGTVIYVNTSYVTITNFTIQNGAGFNGRPYAGIAAYNSNYLNITYNIIKNNNVGIDCEIGSGGNCIAILNNVIISNDNGVIISSYNNVTIANNTITEYNLGLYIGGGEFHKISNNIILSENKGLELYWIKNSTVVCNNVTAYGGTVLKLYHSNECLIAANLISGGRSRNNGDYGINLYSSNENAILHNTISMCKWNGINIFDAENNTISNNTITQCYTGLILHFSKYNSISENRLSNNSFAGLSLFEYSDRNVLVNNRVFNNEYGIFTMNSWYNVVYHNNFINNSQQVYDPAWNNSQIHPSINFWDDGYPSGGNYWSDYVGRYPNAKEFNGSGLWDKPYVIDGNNQDRYPLMYPYGIQTYKLNITTTASGTTTPSPGVHTYANGTIAKVTAIPDINYTLAYWELDGSNAGTNNPIEILMDSNHTLHAVFMPIPYYNLTISTTPGGTTNPALGTYTYANGTTLNVTAIPNIGYSFDYWLLDGQVRTENPITVVMDSNHTLEAYFVDDIPPEISDPWQDPPADNVQSFQNVTVWVNMTDYGTGIKNVTLWYSLDNGTSWTIINMTALPIPSDTTITYEATIPGHENCTWITYKIVAYDNAGNNATKDNNGYYYKYYVIPESPSDIALLGVLTLLTIPLVFAKKKRQPKTKSQTSTFLTFSMATKSQENLLVARWRFKLPFYVVSLFC